MIEFTAPTPPIKVLRPFIDFGIVENSECSYHSLRLNLYLRGQFRGGERTFPFLSMWSPPRYREAVIRSSLIWPILAGNGNEWAGQWLQQSSIEEAGHVDGSEIGKQDLQLLLLTGSYHKIRFEQLQAPLQTILGVQSNLLLGCRTLRDSYEHSLRLKDTLEEGESDIGALCSLFAIHCLLEGGDLEAAKNYLARLRSTIVEGCNAGEQLAKVYSFRASISEGHILLASGNVRAAFEHFVNCLDLPLPKETIEAQWLAGDLKRRHLERIARLALVLGSDAAGFFAQSALSLDPNDGRAWLLVGDCCSENEKAKGSAAYGCAAHLDPICEEVAASMAIKTANDVDDEAKVLFYFKRLCNLAHVDVRSMDIPCRIRALPDHHIIKKWLAQRSIGYAPWSYFAYRNYFDLGPNHNAALMTLGPEVAFHRFAENSAISRPGIQRVMPPAFRHTLIEQSGLKEYHIANPTQLPEKYQTPRWAKLVKSFVAFPTISSFERSNLCRLLAALGFYEPIIQLTASAGGVIPERCEGGSELELLYANAFAEYMLHIGTGLPRSLLEKFKTIAETAAPGSITRFASEMKLIVFSGRYRSDYGDCRKWSSRAASTLEELNSSADEFSQKIWTSRYYRAAAYVPFTAGHFTQTLDVLDLALQCGEAATPIEPWDAEIKRENLYPIYETRVKSYVAAGMMDNALEEANKLVALDPHDAKAWLELGNMLFRTGKFEEAAVAYINSAVFGPPATEIAVYLASKSFEKIGDFARGQELLIATLFADPGALAGAGAYDRAN